MSDFKNDGYNMLARSTQKRMIRVFGAASVTLDFGEIQKDYSLVTNQYPVPMPQTDYFVCRSLTIGGAGSVLTTTQSAGNGNDGTHSHGTRGFHGGHTSGNGGHTHSDEGPHVHDVLIPESLRKLQPGDHVLVAWVGSDPVVIDIIIKASEVK